MAYQVDISARASRQLRDLPADVRVRVDERILALGEVPRPRGVKKMRTQEGDLYRIRVGDYRVIYAIRDEVLIVLVVEVGHRSQVYREY